MADYKEEARTMLKILSDKEFVWFTTRCNAAIELAMTVMAKLTRQLVLYQEEGGWLTYEKYIRQAQLQPIKLITNDGLIYTKELSSYDANGVLLLNSLAGYVAMHDMKDVYANCIANDLLLVNDVSGSIGTKEAMIGDVIVGSFGKGKPVNLGDGGFIATSNPEIKELIDELLEEEAEINFVILTEKLKNLKTRMGFLINRAKEVKTDLKDFNIAHKDHKGLNVIVRFDDDQQKQKILDYCKEKELEYTVCPREIRIFDNAISIEIKRLV